MLANEVPPPAQVHPDTKTSDTVVNTSVVFEKVGQPGVKEQLGNFQRISVITFLLFVNCVLLSLSAFCLYKTELSDYQWHDIIVGGKSFGKLNPPKNLTYFEGKKIRDLPVGRLIYSRKDYIKDQVNYGWDRSGNFNIIQACCMILCLLYCFVHLTLVCCFKKMRRNFQLISLGYGFVGLFVLALCLTTLYFAFVHKVSAYLENAIFPPKSTKLNPADNETINYFVNISYSCAFAFSKFNKNAKGAYSPYCPLVQTTFTIEGVEYSRDEMMELGICPRQDYLLLTSFLLAITTGFCWIASSYSETLENQIIGPPIWLQRFKIKIHKGIRHWKTRSAIPDHHSLKKENIMEPENHHPHPPGLVKINPLHDSTWVDAYGVLDGGADHILLTGPIKDTEASSHKLYHSTSAILSVDKSDR